MDQSSKHHHPLPTLDAFEMYFKTEIRPVAKKILAQRRTIWQRANKPILFILALAYFGPALFFILNYEILAGSGLFTAFLLVGLYVFIFIFAAGVIIRKPEAEFKAALKVAQLSTGYFGWSKPKRGVRQLRVNHAVIAGLLGGGSVETSWSAERPFYGIKIWICDAITRRSDSNIFDGFLVSLPVEVPPALKVVVNSISPGMQGLERGLRRLGRWLSEGGFEEIRTGNKDFDDHFIVHTSDTDFASRLLSYLFLRRVLDEQIALRRHFQLNDIDISFALHRSTLLISVHGGGN